MQVSPSEVIWAVNAYQVAILAFLLPLAMAGDLFGYRRVYLAGAGLFTLASIACMFAKTLPLLSAARAVQGLGAAGIFAVNAALVRAIYPRHLLGRGIAINSAVVAISSVIGPPVSAAVLSMASWHWLFAINLPIGAVVLFLGWRSLPQRVGGLLPSAARASYVDVVLNIATFALLFLGVDGLVPRGDRAVGSPLSALATLAAGIALAVVYVRRQRGLAVPLLPIDLMRIPVFRLSMCTSVAAFAAQMLASVSLPFFLLEELHRSAADAGLVLTAWPIATVLLAAVAGRLIGRVPDGLLGGIGLMAMALGLLSMVFLPADASLVQVSWRLALCGAGFGLFQSPNNHTILTSAPHERSGAAGGMLGTARLTGQSIGALMVALLYGLGAQARPSPAALALALAAACALAATVASMLRLRS